jgi:hypothetical protein
MVSKAWRARSLWVLVFISLGACGTWSSDDDTPNPLNGAGRGGGFAGGGGTAGSGGGGSPPGVSGTTCFEAGSLVATPSGSVPIEELAVGDSVLAFDEQTSSVAARRVKATFAHQVDTSGRLELSDGRILRVTAEHPIYDAALGSYVRADSFDSNRALVTLTQSLTSRIPSNESATFDIEPLSVTLARTAGPGFVRRVTSSPITVYNISVEGLENYFVEGVLAHNKSPPRPPLCPSTPRMWPGVACEDQASCIGPGSPEVEHVPLNQLVAAAGGAGGGDGAGGGPADTSGGGAPEASGGAPVDLGGASGDPSGGTSGGPGTAPAEASGLTVAICPLPTVATPPFLLAVDYQMPETPGGTPGFAIYTGGAACSGWEIAQVLLNDTSPPPAGSLTTQCVAIPTLNTHLSLHSLHPDGKIERLRFASSCDLPRAYQAPTAAPNNPGMPCF